MPKMMSGFFHYRRRSSSTACTVLLFFLLAATLAARCCVDGARSTTTRSGGYVRPAPPGMRLYGYYLQHPKVIPPSGPSEGHNSIGPESSREEAEEDHRMLRKP
ncbi:hypothetical protein BAE44_0005463 [Dichanthelium oligosanthes]|uniref:Secreted protein n=1 Tax=Dichanthelium oligosanthes TaxID=888268 RepID=A0A1E5W8E9_9POAL|nr:hypothetical protein BAE44_0005463 [Dichanthelium oligosanthes]